MTAIPRRRLLKMFKEDQAILEGHFLLSSGLHSPTYLQCARVLMHPAKAEMLGTALADAHRDKGVEAVISPAIGGIIIGQETARALGVRHLFTERTGGAMSLRRGFEIEPGERFLVVEDVLTTGGSTREVMQAVTAAGGIPAAAGAIIFRGTDPRGLGIPFSWLLRLEVPTYRPEECPLCRSGAPPAVKPGSRGHI